VRRKGRRERREARRGGGKKRVRASRDPEGPAMRLRGRPGASGGAGRENLEKLEPKGRGSKRRRPGEAEHEEAPEREERPGRDRGRRKGAASKRLG